MSTCLPEGNALLLMRLLPAIASQDPNKFLLLQNPQNSTNNAAFLFFDTAKQ
jgi:hypothetical protein